MRRRVFITRLGAATSWSVVVRAQKAAMPTVGYLYGRTGPWSRGLGLTRVQAGTRESE